MRQRDGRESVRQVCMCVEGGSTHKELAGRRTATKFVKGARGRSIAGTGWGEMRCRAAGVAVGWQMCVCIDINRAGGWQGGERRLAAGRQEREQGRGEAARKV